MPFLFDPLTGGGFSEEDEGGRGGHAFCGAKNITVQVKWALLDFFSILAIQIMYLSVAYGAKSFPMSWCWLCIVT